MLKYKPLKSSDMIAYYNLYCAVLNNALPTDFVRVAQSKLDALTKSDSYIIGAFEYPDTASNITPVAETQGFSLVESCFEKAKLVGIATVHRLIDISPDAMLLHKIVVDNFVLLASYNNPDSIAAFKDAIIAQEGANLSAAIFCIREGDTVSLEYLD